MILELQIAASQFLAVFREQLKRIPVCVLDDIAIPPSEVPYKLDAYQILDSTSLTAGDPQKTIQQTVNLPNGGSAQISVVPMRVKQDIKLFLAHESDIIAGTSSFLELTPSLEFDLSVQLSGGNFQYCAKLAGVFIGGVQLDVLKIPGIDNICSSVSLSDLVPLVSAGTQIVNAGIAADSLFSRVALRLELGTPASDALAEWVSFFQGLSTDHLQGSDWGVFVDPDTIVHSVGGMFASGLANADPTKFVLSSSPSVVLTEFGGVFFVRITFSGTVPNQNCGLYHVDIGVDVAAGVTFYLSPPNQPNQPNQLGYHIHVDWSTSVGDVLECELGAILGGILVGGVIGGFADGYLGAIVGAIAGIAAVVTAGAIVIGSQGPSFPPIVNCIQQSDHDIDCAVAFSLPPSLGKSTFDSVRLTLEGLLLNGSLAVPDTKSAVLGVKAPQTLDDVFSFTGCPPEGPRGYLDILLDNVGGGGLHSPLFICDYKDIRNDPKKFFFTELIGADSSLSKTYADILYGPITLRVELEKTLEYLQPQNMYPFNLLLKTNGGWQYVTIAPPTPSQLTPVQQALLEAEQLAACTVPVNDFWFQNIYKLEWPDYVTPIESDSGNGYLWQVLVSGMALGEAANLIGSQQQLIGTASAAAGGLAGLTAFIDTGLQDAALSLTRSVGPGASTVSAVPADQGAPPATRWINTRSTLLIQAASVSLSGACQRLIADHFRGAPALFAVTTAGLSVFGISVPGFPRLAYEIVRPGLRGIIRWKDGFLVWGECGPALLLKPENQSVENVEGCSGYDPLNVLDATRFGSYLYTVTTDGIGIYTDRFEKVGHFSLPGGRRATVVGKILAVGTDKGFALLDLSNPRKLRSLGFGDAGGVTELIVGPNAIPSTIFVGSGDAGSIWDLSNPQAPRRVATYRQSPWFANSARIRSTLARLNQSRTGINVYTVARTITGPRGKSPGAPKRKRQAPLTKSSRSAQTARSTAKAPSQSGAAKTARPKASGSAASSTRSSRSGRRPSNPLRGRAGKRPASLHRKHGEKS